MRPIPVSGDSKKGSKATSSTLSGARSIGNKQLVDSVVDDRCARLPAARRFSTRNLNVRSKRYSSVGLFGNVHQPNPTQRSGARERENTVTVADPFRRDS